MKPLFRSFSLLFPAALFLSFATSAQEPPRENIFDRIGKATGKAVSEASFQIHDKLDFTADDRTRAAIEEANELRILRASAAGRFVNEHFTNKIVVPVFFNCQGDPLEEKELEAFMDQALSVKMAGPVYITPPDGALPLPDERPTAAQLNEALLRSMELRADAVVVFTGLPDRRKEKAKLVFHQWSENAPRLILTEVTDSFFLKRSMFPCPIAAAILPRTIPPDPETQPRPWYDRLFSSQDAPAEPDPFDLRYILLCDENADGLTADGTVFLYAEKKENGKDDLSRLPWLNWIPETGKQEDFLHRSSSGKDMPSVIFPDDVDQAYRDLFHRSGLSFVKTTPAVEEIK